jgi:hypothetical protein
MFRSFVYPGARLTPEKASIPRELREPTVVILDHSGFRIIGLFSNNVVSFSRNVVLRGPLFSANVVPKQRMFLGQAIYVLWPLQIAIEFVLKNPIRATGCSIESSVWRGEGRCY